MVTSNVHGYSVLGEHINDESLCKLWGVDLIYSRDEYSLFGELINYNEDRGIARGCG